MSDRSPNRARGQRLARTVFVLGTASLLTDLSSEMIYPLLPAFIAGTLGAGPLVLGWIEGVAESTAALMRVVSGRWADRAARRKPFVVLGYGLSGTVRPLIGLAASWPAVLALRFSDRIGKGVRGAPRDALIADVTPSERRGAAFGVQRAMDHAGATLGPLAATALLAVPGMTLRSLFLCAAVPAAAVIVVLVVGVKERRPAPGARVVDDVPRGPAPAPTPRPTLRAAWRSLSGDFRRLLIALAIFTLGNSTDAFLLLRLGGVGFDLGAVALLWGAHNVVKMVVSAVAGSRSDRLGRRRVVTAGWLVYAAVYGAFALVESPTALAATFLAYGVCFGLTEPVEKAWVAQLVPAELRATAFGFVGGAVGLMALPASVLFGVVAQTAGASWAFGAGAFLALVAVAQVIRVSDTGPEPRAEVS